MACRIRVATVNARLDLPEIIFGILPGFGGIQLLQGLAGRGKTIEMLLTDKKALAKDVREIDQTNHVVSSNRLITEGKRLQASLQKKD
jgi:enoyl-CoA hydratase